MSSLATMEFSKPIMLCVALCVMFIYLWSPQISDWDATIKSAEYVQRLNLTGRIAALETSALKHLAIISITYYEQESR